MYIYLGKKVIKLQSKINGYTMKSNSKILNKGDDGSWIQSKWHMPFFMWEAIQSTAPLVLCLTKLKHIGLWKKK